MENTIYFAIGVFSSFFGIYFTKAIMAFFDGWDGKQKPLSKIYIKLFSLGLALRVKEESKKK